MIDGDRVETLALAVWARGGQAPLRAQTVMSARGCVERPLPPRAERAADGHRILLYAFIARNRAPWRSAAPSRHHCRRVTFSKSCEFPQLCVPIVRRKPGFAAMTPRSQQARTNVETGINRPLDPAALTRAGERSAAGPAT